MCISRIRVSLGGCFLSFVLFFSPFLKGFVRSTFLELIDRFVCIIRIYLFAGWLFFFCVFPFCLEQLALYGVLELIDRYEGDRVVKSVKNGVLHK